MMEASNLLRLFLKDIHVSKLFVSAKVTSKYFGVFRLGSAIVLSCAN
ncbi:hypothetical protein MCY_00075 [Bartonella rattimassiliensis 15908]|uniref:Uncharacterized protein n=1 Tax=Bartonella rattimassiliensis 15908 TaxID=1094556 RepID=J0QX76_9HYPH|nr:hypothetical protein MCY_00075 [Bartonella rattimassiliensis 15908]